jgi:hypothetical protein
VLIAALTRPTWGRVALWLGLAVAWSALLLADYAGSAHPHHPVRGAIFGLAVLGWLAGMALATLQRTG